MIDAFEVIKNFVIVISPVVLLIVIFYIASKMFRENYKFEEPKKDELKIDPEKIARRVIYKEELYHLKAKKGTAAYVINDKAIYLYNGISWVKDGEVGK